MDAKVLIGALAVCLAANALADSHDPVLQLRNSVDAGNVQVIPNVPKDAPVLWVYDYSLEPKVTFFALGSGFTVSNRTLSVTGGIGPQGPQGPAGERGIAGQSIVGPAGPKGDRGDAGQSIVGPKGDKGDAGASIVGPKGDKGDAGASLVGPAGATGATGPANVLTIGAVSQGTAAASITGTSPAQVLNLTLPVASKSFAMPTRTLNTAYQISATRDAHVSCSVDISVTSLILAGGKGSIYLDYSDTAAMTTNLVTASSGANSTSGVLNLTNLGTVTVAAFIPAGKYARLRTTADTGAPAFTLRSCQEVLL